ncbi:helix-turn-helix domain-containing protein [Leuconostoc gasicomitatum]|uniref:helix-turn-helix domain-containing protein n=1 Tax=Leuconostoc gasicomitatum TaxID=115778 RepID=UPI0007E28BC2|nr:Transposase, IS30 family [Leuconostoc gasicomitatum]
MKRQSRLNENQRYLIKHLWNDEQLSQTDIGRQLGYDPSVISRELDRGNVLDFSSLDRQWTSNKNYNCKFCELFRQKRA